MFSIHDAWAKVITEHPELLRAKAETEAVGEEVNIAKSFGLPSVQAQSSQTFHQVREGGQANEFTASVSGIDVTQSLYSGGRLKARENRARSLVAVQNNRVSLIEQDLLLRTLKAYSGVYRDQLLLERTLGNEQRVLAQFEAIKKRFKLGDATASDVAEAEAVFAAVSAERAEILASLKTLGASFVQLVGQEPEELGEIPEPSYVPASLEEALLFAPDHAAYQLAKGEQETAGFDLDLARAESKPQLNLNGAANLIDNPDENQSWRQDFRIGATLNVPLYQGGGIRARVRQAKANRKAMQLATHTVRRQVEEDIRRNWEARQATALRLEALVQQARAAAIAVDTTIAEASAGLRRVTDILDSERELLAAERSLFEARQQYLVQSYELLAALGFLNGAELGIHAQQTQGKSTKPQAVLAAEQR